MFSKKYDHQVNPHEDFTALLVCANADEACPVVPGADARFAIPYKDPKVADNTPEENAMYAARCRQIAREMLYITKVISDMTQQGRKQLTCPGACGDR